MDNHLILSVISDDKPGIVKDIAKVVNESGGNWLESQLSHLAGKFAGIIRVSVVSEHQEALCNALSNLKSDGIKVYVEELTLNSRSPVPSTASFSAMGPDRPGIVREIAQALSRYQINLENFSSRCGSMPYSGDPLFEATGELSIPANTPMDEVYELLCDIADQLAIDIHLDEAGEGQIDNP